MLSLMGSAGLVKGRSWVVTQTPLLVGRDQGCHVHILDPVVSRQHCEITLGLNGLRLRNLSGMNPTLVNGAPVAECTLGVGDEIRIGRNAFLVSRLPSELPLDDEDPACQSTLSISEEESLYLSEASPAYQENPEHARREELQELFALARSFSRATSTSSLVAMLSEAVHRRYGQAIAWLLLYRGEEEEWIGLAPKDTPPDALGAPPKELMIQALRKRSGLMVSTSQPQTPGNVPARASLAAPMLLGEHRIGVLAVTQLDQPSQPIAAVLDYLVALAHTIAPLFRAVERIAQLERDNQRLAESSEKLPRLIGTSREMERVRQIIRLTAPSPHPVLILGETGTGKEIVASLVHELSDHAQEHMVTVNCAAIPRELFESEFFGYERGAFTGAQQRKIGLLEQSDHGTLFLDEVGDLSPENQARILRAIETKQFRRIGGKDEICVDFRVVGATNKDLAALTLKNAFRADLYHRLKGIEIHIPPLRERRADIPELARHFLSGACSVSQRAEVSISSRAMEFLINQSWRGNVRELKQCIEAAVTICESSHIEPEDLWLVSSGNAVEEMLLPMVEVEKRHILAALQYCNGNVLEAAKLLGIGKSTLYNKLSEYDMKP